MEYGEGMFPVETLFLVTGVAGFIGSHLAERLLRMGYQVRGLDNLVTGKRENHELFGTSQRLEFFEGDIRDHRHAIEHVKTLITYCIMPPWDQWHSPLETLFSMRKLMLGGLLE